MSSLELGQATIVYDDPDEGRTEVTVDNEKMVYARDHWMVQSGTDEAGNDLMKQIPKERVHYVERNVERFEEQVQTLRHRVESVAKDLQRRLPVDVGGRSGSGRGGRGGPAGGPSEESTKIHIEESEGSGRSGESE